LCRRAASIDAPDARSDTSGADGVTQRSSECTLRKQACGDRLLANFRTEHDGWVRFELVERLVWPPQEWPGIEGFRFQDTEPLTGDQTHAPVCWMGSPDLSKLNGRDIGIRVRLHKARLFSVTMYGVDEPSVQEDPRYPV